MLFWEFFQLTFVGGIRFRMLLNPAAMSGRVPVNFSVKKENNREEYVIFK